MKLLTKYNYQNHRQQVLFCISLLLTLTLLLTQTFTTQALLKVTNKNQISQNTERSGGIPYKRLVIGGISLSMSEAQVRRILGKPIKQKNGYEAIAGKTRTLQYVGISVDLLDDVEETGKFSVYQIKVNSSKYSTLDKVKVGDNLSKVIAIYGQPETSESRNDTNTLSYKINSESPAYFNFTIQNSRVKTISCGDFLG